MFAYIIRRFLLMIPTLFGIMVLNFAIVQFAPGGPAKPTIAQCKGTPISVIPPIVGWQSDLGSKAPDPSRGSSNYRGARGLDPGIIQQIEQMYGFDKPAPERFWMMMKD